MIFRNKMEEIIEGKHRLPEDERLKMEFMKKLYSRHFWNINLI